MLYYTIHKIPFLRKNFEKYFSGWGAKKLALFYPYLSESETILDIGSGSGLISSKLLQKDRKVTSVDLSDSSLIERVRPIVYDGETLPFSNSSFDAALLITVLHHCTEPKKVLSEALRVGKRVVILEDVYTNRLQRFFTQLADTLVNFGSSKMPYQNKSCSGWLAVFQELNAKVVHEEGKRTAIFFRQHVFIIEAHSR
jgi:SAM-dependent methyltransferase